MNDELPALGKIALSSANGRNLSATKLIDVLTPIDFRFVYSFSRPTTQQLQAYLEQQGQLPFSYLDLGATLQIEGNSAVQLSSRYTIDRHRICLGTGVEVFARGKEALCRWEMFQLDWVELYGLETSIQAGTTVGILVHQGGLWSLNPCRIVDVIEEKGSNSRFGFAYGTLPDHSLSGEERFLVEWFPEDNTVWYELFAFSRPHQWLSRIDYWYVRRLQKRFASDSLSAMVRAAS